MPAHIKSKSVSFSRELWREINALSERRYHGNRSAYFRELVERDLKKRAARTARRGIVIPPSPAAQNRWTSPMEGERGDTSRECAAGAPASFATPTPIP